MGTDDALEKRLKDTRDEGQLEGMIFILDILDRLLDRRDNTGGIHPVADSRFQRVKKKIKELQASAGRQTT